MSVDPVISFLVQKAGDSLIEELEFLHGVKEQVEEMKIELQWMQCFLEDADETQIQSRVFGQWVAQIREASLDAEDIVDTFLVRIALSNSNRLGIVKFFNKHACLVLQGREIHVVGSKIEAVKSRLSTLRTRLQIYGMGSELRLGQSSSSSNRIKPLWRRQSYAHTPDTNVVGLEGKIEEVVGLLLREQDPSRAVSIYGMGGLGKTTLAKKVYHDKRVRTRFDSFAWVYISQQFKQRDIWESILIELTSPSAEERKEIARLRDRELASKLFQVQKDQKCLVVVDDVWSMEDWDNLRPAFPFEGTDSKILLTTRKEGVALRVDWRGIYGALQPLSHEQSLELLCIIAMAGRDGSNEKCMEELGEEMVKHCAGLPLAIIVLGGVLATKHRLTEWQLVHDNIKSYLRRGTSIGDQEHFGVQEILALSYYDLPYQLKPCFLYFSQFPEDYEIRTNRLLKMWMAESFVSVQYDGDMEETMEDVAERYLNELVSRCIIRVEKVGSTGRVKTCRVHDLMREMCLSKAKEQNFLHFETLGSGNNVIASKALSTGRIRRLAVFADQDLSLSSYRRNPHLRSLICFSGATSFSNASSCSVLKNFKLLRVLTLEGISARDRTCPKVIGKLVHLKYLSLKNSEILYVWLLPVTNLKCLQTLDLRISWSEKGAIPNAIWRMKQLRHLYLPYGASFPAKGKLQMENQQNLQTLVNFPPSNCDLKVMMIKFTNLRKLQINGGRQIKEFGEVLKTQKIVLNRLWSLSLVRNESLENVDLEAMFSGCPYLYKLYVDGSIEKFPEINQFPTNLTKFGLKNSRLQDSTFLETIGKLPNLKILHLWKNSFIGTKLCFHGNGFIRLESLELHFLRGLKEWSIGEGVMPKLGRLVISSCGELVMVPDGLRLISSLSELHIKWMPKDFKRRVEEGGDDFYKVRHVAFTVFYRCD